MTMLPRMRSAKNRSGYTNDSSVRPATPVKRVGLNARQSRPITIRVKTNIEAP